MLPIVTLPDERLFSSSETVEGFDEELDALIEGMIETMHGADGVGLAAVQVGVMKRLFVVHAPKDEVRVFVNPQIEAYSDKIVSYEEGCLSIPGVYSEVLRPQEIRIKALDRAGNEFVLEPGDFLARVIQHEFDHLNGKLFYQHLKTRQQARFLRAYERTHGLPADSLTGEA